MSNVLLRSLALVLPDCPDIRRGLDTGSHAFQAARTTQAATAAAVYAVIEATARSGEAELQIVAAQDALLALPRRFAVQRVA